ncbi:Vacuolar amino acid transporter protein 1 [Pyrenophora tritici-repentis]|nr:Vacuolar amino acid transporter protein 1 [Pyrenophora tritici-repentis]KAI1592629.1 SdaC Amino acid permease [Pyrenophora tritici-repentis]
MDIRGKQPSTWDAYEGVSRTSVDSDTESHVQWDELERRPSGASNAGTGRWSGTVGELRRRRSSIGQQFGALGDAGGVNSINNFARSWQRAAGFFEITPVRPSIPTPIADQRSALRNALQNEGRRASDNAVADEEQGATERMPLLPGAVENRLRERGSSIFQIEPSLSSPFGASYGTQYGSLASRVNESSMRHAGRLFTEQQLKGVAEPEQEREPLLVKQVEEDGHIINVVVGQSTLPQTIFNSVNVLVGVGLLTLPLAFKYSGWLIGMVFLLWSAIVTGYTAKLLAKCLDVDGSLITFADLAYVSYGTKARVAVSILFSLELLAACVALVVLFADSMDALIPGWDVFQWKIVCGLILIPLSFLPLRFLSFTSILGVMSCFGITAAIWIDGLVKPDAPGSIRQPTTQYLFPENWMTIPLSIGLLMSPWGGHSVFPNIYRDMRHPYKYRKAVNVTYGFTYLIDVGMACAGILMFGDNVREEVTSNIFLTAGFPKGISVFIAICIAIIPLTKIPLNARPIVSTLEVLFGLDTRSLAMSTSMDGMSGLTRGILKVSQGLSRPFHKLLVPPTILCGGSVFPQINTMSPSITYLIVVGLAFLATSECAFDALVNLIASSNLTRTALVSDDESHGLVLVADNDLWTLAVARGAKLLQGMKASDTEAATLYGLGTTAESPFDGDLIDELREWGYNDDNDALAKQADPECNFDSRDGHMLAKAFRELKIGTKSKNKGGPNQCFLIEHFDGPAVKKGDGGQLPAKTDQRYDVCGKEYKVTNAEHSIGANAESGALYVMQISSAAKAARQLWKRAPLVEELPAIRSVSDIAWAFWNRVHQDGGLDNIKYLFFMMIINKETNQYVKRALDTLSPPKEEADGWAGNDFAMDTDEGKALLGSPVGRWAGYFLLQHKRQLGGNKYISKVRVFKSEKEGSSPYFLFYVEGPAAMAEKREERNEPEIQNRNEEPKIVGRSVDGKHIIREHVVRARL